MKASDSRVTRRSFLAAGSVGAMASVALPRQVAAIQLSTDEQANLTAVNDFCAAFTVPLDWDTIASYLSTGCKYRASQDIPMVEGPEAIVGLLKGFLGNATSVEFEMLDTWARGPVVVNDRVDRFVMPTGTVEFPVVGIFYMADGKIVEWTDYVFETAP
jgi:limonene-1,2-epoxide hydrolase